MEVKRTLELIGLFFEKAAKEMKTDIKESIDKLNESLEKELCTCEKGDCPVHKK